MILLKLLKRRTSLEGAASELAEVEFKTPSGDYDLSPSAYEIDDTLSVIARTLAEHGANASLDPPGCRSGGGVDLNGALPRPPEPLAESGYFSFIREAHREVHLRDHAELMAVLEVVVGQPARGRWVPKADVRAHVCAKLSAGDQEWNHFCREAPKGGKWRRWAVS